MLLKASYPINVYHLQYIVNDTKKVRSPLSYYYNYLFYNVYIN